MRVEAHSKAASRWQSLQAQSRNRSLSFKLGDDKQAGRMAPGNRRKLSAIPTRRKLLSDSDSYQ